MKVACNCTNFTCKIALKTYVKAVYGRMTDSEYGPFYSSFGKPVADSIGLRYCVRVQLDITKPVNFDSISVLAL